MKTEITAQQIPSNIGAVQTLTIREGVTLDQDGNRFADAATKLTFLRDCLAQGIRSGNLQPITTVHQCRDLVSRINAAAKECGGSELSALEVMQAEADAANHEEIHSLRMKVEAKMRASFMLNRSSTDRSNNVPFNGAGAMARIHGMSVSELQSYLA